MSIQVFCPVFNQVAWGFFDIECMSYLYIDSLDINPLLVILFANISSHSVGCLFVLSMVSLLCKAFKFN